ncbi:MAG: radical SAM protein [Candidatus Omnitrophota bacterium]|nr:radical SAM protein [Candidatus Omnitrophota bacterium]MBU1928465.1 radical SAM protein [Candidatus Omnitrophota bacterium]MBU2035462.1 radical SAM protein [Candidatus Omnitrophota bacterium]MBU2221235.1 radical SAM protein [Candidatus Omnitrophota bacterium]
MSLNRPSACRFELTFRCVLHCRHCYTDCFNKKAYSKKELTTKEVKFVLDRLACAGVIWLCLSGGDPIVRDDFLEIYAYARKKGFITTIFTNGYSLNRRIIKYLKKNPPFVIEITLNAVDKDLYEKISRIQGSFAKTMRGIGLILDSCLQFKIKTQVTKDNFKHLPQIKKYLKGIGSNFTPNHILYPNLNGDIAPCKLRITPEQVLGLYHFKKQSNDGCEGSSSRNIESRFYPCVISSADGIYVDPYGNMFLCDLLRKPKVNLLRADIKSGLNRLSSYMAKEEFKTDSKCRDCNLRPLCGWCPGKAYLETGGKEKPLDYYCRLTRLFKKHEI